MIETGNFPRFIPRRHVPNVRNAFPWCPKIDFAYNGTFHLPIARHGLLAMPMSVVEGGKGGGGIHAGVTAVQRKSLFVFTAPL